MNKYKVIIIGALSMCWLFAYKSLSCISAKLVQPTQNQTVEQRNSLGSGMATNMQTESPTPTEIVNQPFPPNEQRKSESERPTRPSVGEDSISYVKANGFFVPVSYVVKGAQLLVGDIGPYSIIADEVLKDAPPAENLAQIAAPQGSGFEAIASSGTWNFYPNTVQYKRYSIENQPQQQEWIRYFEKKLDEFGYDGPILIRQSASIQENTMEIAVVTASNVLSSGTLELLEKPFIYHIKQPANNMPGVYMITALFIPGQPPLEVLFQYEKISPSLGSGYFPWTQDIRFMQALFAMQFDSAGNIIECPVYMDMTGASLLRNLSAFPDVLIADINGDASSEIVVCVNTFDSLSNWCKVFYLTSNLAEASFSISLN